MYRLYEGEFAAFANALLRPFRESCRFICKVFEAYKVAVLVTGGVDFLYLRGAVVAGIEFLGSRLSNVELEPEMKQLCAILRVSHCKAALGDFFYLFHQTCS